MAIDKSSFVPVGRLGRAHGLKGEIRFFADSLDFDSFSCCSRLIIGDPSTAGAINCRMLNCRLQGKAMVVSLSGITTRTEAESLTGREIWVAKEELPALDDGNLFRHHLIGKEIFTDEGQHLGQVRKMLDTGPYEIMIISGAGNEYMVPALTEFVRELTEDKIVVNLPEGLLDINR